MTQTYKVQVSMNQAHIVESGFVWKQGDFGFNIEIEVLDFDTTGATPQIIFRKSTGAVEATQISVAGNKFTYAIRGTELDTPGPCVCDLKLNDSTTKRVSTASFKYFVIPDTMDGLEQEASSYSDTIEQLMDEVIHLSDTPGLVKNDGTINENIENNVSDLQVVSDANEQIIYNHIIPNAKEQIQATNNRIEECTGNLNEEINRLRIKTESSTIQKTFNIANANDENLENTEGDLLYGYVFTSNTDAALQVDNNVTEASSNPVKSSGIYSAIMTVYETLDTKINEIDAEETIIRNSVISIAPSNASSFLKERADYVCTGENDQIIINAAINSITNGGEIHLMAGLFHLSDSIIIDRDITIIGEGSAIGGIPAYVPTNGIVYGEETANYYTLRQNLYGATDGRNTCIRVDSDISAIVCNADHKICLCLRDFYINGYGRDRSSKAGIDILCPTDVSEINRVGITDCYVGIYAYGNASQQYGYCDCLWISKCSLQQCGIGIIARCNSSYITENCIADNIGVVDYRDVTAVNSGGLYIEGDRNTILNNQFVYVDLFCPNPCYAVRLLCHDSRMLDNSITFLNGGCIRNEGYCNMIHANRLQSYGWSNTPGYNIGIDIRDNLSDIQTNYLGNVEVSGQEYACNYYGVASSLPLSYQKTNVSNNTFINIMESAVDSTTLGSSLTANNNAVWSYIN